MHPYQEKPQPWFGEGPSQLQLVIQGCFPFLQKREACEGGHLATFTQEPRWKFQGQVHTYPRDRIRPGHGSHRLPPGWHMAEDQPSKAASLPGEALAEALSLHEMIRNQRYLVSSANPTRQLGTSVMEIWPLRSALIVLLLLTHGGRCSFVFLTSRGTNLPGHKAGQQALHRDHSFGPLRSRAETQEPKGAAALQKARAI